MEKVIEIIIQVIVVVSSITFHEFSHGLVAYWLGDDTAKRAGRLTLNPISHLDPLGAIMLLIAHIGWAKPVPINPYNFQDLKKGTALTAAAGPASNFLLALISAFILRLFMHVIPPYITNSIFFMNYIILFLYFCVFINIALGLFNLIPFPPLDGSKIIGGFMSDSMYFSYTAKEKQGAILLMIIMAISWIFHIPIFSLIIDKPLRFLTSLLIGQPM